MAAPVKFLVMTFCLLEVMRRFAHAWMTDYDLPFVFECPTFQSLTYLKSVHDNRREDRVWDFGCSPLPLTVGNPRSYTCQWSGYVNDFDGQLSYQCPGNGYIAGLYSYHDNRHEDRRFKVYCCSFQELIPYSCISTIWLNDFDGLLNYRVPSSLVLRGIRQTISASGLQHTQREKSHAVYFPGEIIKGELHVQPLDPIVFPKILPRLKLQLRGQGKVVLRQSWWGKVFLRTRELYIKTGFHLRDLQRALPEAGQQQETTVYKFEFLLPLGLPPSFTSPKGKWGRIKYRLELVRVERFYEEILLRSAISVAPFAPLDGNLQALLPARDEKTNAQHYLCCGNDINISARALLTKAGVLTGQKILFFAQVVNYSDDAVKSCHVTLRRRWVWHSIGETSKRSERVKSFRKVSRGPIPPGGTLTWGDDEPLMLPNGLIPTGPPGCTIMNVSYELRFIVVPQGMARNMTLRLPVIVGSDLPQDMRADAEMTTAGVRELARLAVVLQLLRNASTDSTAAERSSNIEWNTPGTGWNTNLHFA